MEEQTDNSRYHCGIDPGGSGAIAILDVQVPENSPPILVALYRLTPNNISNSILTLEALCGSEHATAKVLCEQQHAWKDDTPVSAFSFGRNVGQIEGQFHLAKVLANMQDRSVSRTFESIAATAWQGTQFMFLSRSGLTTKQLAALHVTRTWSNHEYLIEDFVGDIAKRESGNNVTAGGHWFPDYCIDAICIALHSTGYKPRN